jgi:hypothetical protein
MQSMCLADWLSIYARKMNLLRKSANEHGWLIQFVLHHKKYWAKHSRRRSQRRCKNLIKAKNYNFFLQLKPLYTLLIGVTSFNISKEQLQLNKAKIFQMWHKSLMPVRIVLHNASFTRTAWVRTPMCPCTHLSTYFRHCAHIKNKGMTMLTCNKLHESVQII